MTALVQRVGKNKTGRDIIVGDVHGNFTGLMQAMRGIGFNPDAGDRLFHVGDLVDRGAESIMAPEWLDQPWVFAVAGNHENMASRWPSGNMDWGNYAANGGSWMMALDRPTQIEVASALGALPIAIELETADGLVGIVHAECPLSPWSDFTSMLEDPALSSRKRRDLTEYAQWARTRIELRNASMIAGVRAVVVGHTPMEKSVTLGNHIYIDTMGWRPGGHFTLLDASTLQPAGQP